MSLWGASLVVAAWLGMASVCRGARMTPLRVLLLLLAEAQARRSIDISLAELRPRSDVRRAGRM